MDSSWGYVGKIAIASLLISAAIKLLGPALALPEATAVVIVIFPALAVAGWLVSRF